MYCAGFDTHAAASSVTLKKTALKSLRQGKGVGHSSLGTEPQRVGGGQLVLATHGVSNLAPKHKGLRIVDHVCPGPRCPRGGGGSGRAGRGATTGCPAPANQDFRQIKSEMAKPAATKIGVDNPISCQLLQSPSLDTPNLHGSEHATNTPTSHALLPSCERNTYAQKNAPGHRTTHAQTT